MDPLTLLTVGPALIRTIGSLFGGKTSDVASKIANVVDSVRGMPPEQAQAKVTQAISAMSPEDLIELKKIETHLAEIERDREANRLSADTAQFAASQETIRKEMDTGDEYVKHTRPMMARISTYSGLGYIVLAELISKIAQFNGKTITGADVAMAGTLLGPAGFYMTMRTVDAFSQKGKS